MVDSALPVVVFKVSIQISPFIHIYFPKKILVFHSSLLDKLLLDNYDSGAKTGPFLGFICFIWLTKEEHNKFLTESSKNMILILCM